MSFLQVYTELPNRFSAMKTQVKNSLYIQEHHLQMFKIKMMPWGKSNDNDRYHQFTQECEHS